ncbi:clostripain-related cysteine peptidase [Butyrivibrio sp.]|uniref:clostripain-related cysteine peptidase n=1 Tax=Butyrivibrio sp. TaxID=28121 RepID=UPI0025BA78C3|nr:clostripain-related cysteine peptidase [Butyrivibrio sp.]
MGKKLKSILVVLLSSVMVVTSPLLIGVNSFTSYAASISVYDQLQKLYPIGTVLKSDSFAGLLISYDGKETYEVKDGSNKVALNITVLDEKLAKTSLPSLKFFFGLNKLELKKGKTLSFSAIFTGISKEGYKSLLQKTGNKTLIDALENGTEIPMSVLTAIADTREFEAFDTAIAEAVKEQAELERENTQDPGEDTSDSEDQDIIDLYTRTIMIFLNGTDLESNSCFGTKNMLDLLRANIPDNTKIYITTGGTNKWHMNDGDYYADYACNLLYPGKQIAELDENEKKEVNKYADELYNLYATDISRDVQIYEVLKDDNNTNYLSLRETYTDLYFLDNTYLTDFIDYVTSSTSSEYYDLILWDHGNGIKGYGFDEIYDNDVKEGKTDKRNDVGFTLDKLMASIENSDFIQDGKKFDFIGFDACQMATIEVADALHGYSDYLIFSEENEPGAGWDYYEFMTAYSENPDMETTELATNIIDSYMDQYKDNSGNITLALFDCSKMDDLDEALSDFALALLGDIKDITGYEMVITTIGKEGDYGVKNGYDNNCLLDIVKLCNKLSNEQGISPALQNASINLKNSINNNAIIYACGKDKEYVNCGLSINFPIQPFTRVYAGKNEKGDLNYINAKASDVEEIYGNINANDVYMKAYAQLALTTVSAFVVGDLWKDTTNYNVDDIIKILEDKSEDYKTSVLIEKAGIDFEEAKDLKKIISYFVENRVKKNNITITKDDEKQTATIKIVNVDPVVIDDTVNVQVALKIDDTYQDIGQTSLFTSASEKSTDNRSVSITVKPFDQKWYTLNDQITSFYMTYFDSETNTYYGYIPLTIWNNVGDVATPDGYEKRENYFKKAASDGKLRTIFLNVSSENDKFTFDSYQDISNGEAGPYNDVESLEGCYLELLSGASYIVDGATDVMIHSIGTVFFDKENSLKLQTITDLMPIYTLSDSYGNQYELSKDEFGSDVLETYVTKVDGYDTTFEKSQALAEKVRKQAAEDAEGMAQNSENDQSADETDSDKSLRAAGTDEPTEPTISEAKSETTDAVEVTEDAAAEEESAEETADDHIVEEGVVADNTEESEILEATKETEESENLEEAKEADDVDSAEIKETSDDANNVEETSNVEASNPDAQSNTEDSDKNVSIDNEDAIKQSEDAIVNEDTAEANDAEPDAGDAQQDDNNDESGEDSTSEESNENQE